VRRTKNLDFYLCNALYCERQGAGTSRQVTSRAQSGKKDSMMFKVEDIQSYSKEQLEGIQAIATAYGDYSKKSYEDTKSYVEKLSGVKSLDKAIEVQTEYAKSAYESFVAESQKIASLYTDLVKQAYKPPEGVVAKFTPAAH